MKRQTKREAIINSFSDRAELKQETYKSLIILTFLNTAGKPCTAIWDNPKDVKPAYNYSFADKTQRSDFIAGRKHSADLQEIREQEQEKERKEQKDKIQIGSILYSSWGYEQTNIDFYIVIDRRNDFVLLQEIGQNKNYDNNFNDRGKTEPNPSHKIGDPFRKKITKYGSIDINSFSCARPYDNNPKYWSAYA